MLETRLTPLAHSWGFVGIPELVQTLKRGTEPRLAIAVTQAMNANETTFFRDKQPFEELKSVILPALLTGRRPPRPLRIWSAGCSTGQEPYSIAMTIAESFPGLRTRAVEILASDIDSRVLARAERGIYSQFDVQRGLPIQLLMKHFDQLSDHAGWQMKPQFREQITWIRLNLLDSFARIGKPDVVFCSNVLISFEPAARRDVLGRMAEWLAPDGFLVLGAAESVSGIGDAFQRERDCKSAVYRPTMRKSLPSDTSVRITA